MEPNGDDLEQQQETKETPVLIEAELVEEQSQPQSAPNHSRSVEEKELVRAEPLSDGGKEPSPSRRCRPVIWCVVVGLLVLGVAVGVYAGANLGREDPADSKGNSNDNGISEREPSHNDQGLISVTYHSLVFGYGLDSGTCGSVDLGSIHIDCGGGGTTPPSLSRLHLIEVAGVDCESQRTESSVVCTPDAEVSSWTNGYILFACAVKAETTPKATARIERTEGTGCFQTVQLVDDGSAVSVPSMLSYLQLSRVCMGSFPDKVILRDAGGDTCETPVSKRTGKLIYELDGVLDTDGYVPEFCFLKDDCADSDGDCDLQVISLKTRDAMAEMDGEQCEDIYHIDDEDIESEVESRSIVLALKIGEFYEEMFSRDDLVERIFAAPPPPRRTQNDKPLDP